MEFLIGINDHRTIKKGYSLFINDKLVLSEMADMPTVLKEIKKYLRLRFKEPLK